MARSNRRGLRFTLSQFDHYLQETQQSRDACYQEVEQVQQALQAVFDKELAAWNETFSYCYPQVMSRRRELPADFQAVIDRVEGEERARIRGEISDLDQKVKNGRKQMDEYLAQAQTATENLRKFNPGLNQREEILKAQVVQFQDEYTDAFEQLEKLDTSPLGWLTNLGQIRRLKKVQRMAKQQQAQAMVKLRNVRQDWLERVEKTSDTQAELRKKWQELGVEVAEAEGEKNRLETNFDQLVENAAIQRVLQELKHAPDLSDELGDKLRELAQRNKTREAYEEALRQIAETVGRLKGLGDGLERFSGSVRDVLREQRRYNLAQVNVLLSPAVEKMNANWPELRQAMADQKELAQKPDNVARTAERYNTDRLSDEQIKDYFEEMGAALNAATSRWG